jgi:hypothetical protein
VTTVRGLGRALIGSEVVERAPLDIVETPPWAPHRRAPSLGVVCGGI